MLVIEIDFALTMSAKTVLVIKDQSPHTVTGRAILRPVRLTTGGLTAYGIPVPGFELLPLASTMRTCSPGESLGLLGGIGHPAVLAVHAGTFPDDAEELFCEVFFWK